MGHEEYRSMVCVLLHWGNYSKEVKRSSMEIVCCALPPIPLPSRFFIYNQECRIQGTSNYSNTRENRACLFKTKLVRSQNTLFDCWGICCFDCNIFFDTLAKNHVPVQKMEAIGTIAVEKHGKPHPILEVISYKYLL